MRGSQIQFGSESRQSSFGSRLRTSQVINPHFPSLSFVASFLAAFGRLDPFDPRFMYLSLPFSIFGPFQWTDTRRDVGQSPVQWQSLSDERKREKLR